MKDKEKQIEEMVSIMAASNNPFVDVPVEIMPNVAEALYNAGYRKLPENSIVLSNEEYERITKELVTEQRATEIAKEYFEKTCNETAEKFLQLAYDRCLEKSFIKKVEELAKQFGVEIKE